MKICCLYRCAVNQPQCTASLFRAKCSPHCSVLLCKTGLQLACITAITPMKSPLLSAALQDRLAAGSVSLHYTYDCIYTWSYRCAVNQHQCTASLFFAKCSAHSSALLCKTGLQQACITAITPMKLCCSYRCAVTQHQCTGITLFRAKCSAHCSVLLCKTGLQLYHCITPTKLCCHQVCSYTYDQICCSCRCAVTQHQCTITLFRAKCSAHCSVLLCKTGLQLACITAITPMKICCSYRCAVNQHQCTVTLFRGKCSATQLSAALQDRLAGLYHCNIH